MFNLKKLDKLKIANKNLSNQLLENEMKLQELQRKFKHKNNELFDIASSAFLDFRKIVEIAERNSYDRPEQKISQIKEYAEKQRNYYAQLTLDFSDVKNRTTTTDQSNR